MAIVVQLKSVWIIAVQPLMSEYWNKHLGVHMLREKFMRAEQCLALGDLANEGVATSRIFLLAGLSLHQLGPPKRGTAAYSYKYKLVNKYARKIIIM